MRTFNWEVYCTSERTAGINLMETIINRFAYILDFHSFSDLSLSITAGVEEWRANALFDEIARNMEIEGEKPAATESKNECMIYINISFAKGKGDMRHEVPDVPG